MGSIGFVCFTLSPVVVDALIELGERLEMTWMLAACRVSCFASVGMLAFGALLIASGPAEVSTQADNLMECLNDVRISDFSPETHEKVSIIECAMASSNHGQGVGFCVLGMVIDKRVLKQIGVGLLGRAQVALPFVLAFSVYAAPAGTRDDASTDATGDACSLTLAQQNAIRATAEAVVNGSCSYNVTLDAVMHGA